MDGAVRVGHGWGPLEGRHAERETIYPEGSQDTHSESEEGQTWGLKRALGPPSPPPLGDVLKVLML